MSLILVHLQQVTQEILICLLELSVKDLILVIHELVGTVGE